MFKPIASPQACFTGSRFWLCIVAVGMWSGSATHFALAGQGEVSSYHWTTSDAGVVTCSAHSLSGHTTQVANSFCRQTEGSHYAWTKRDGVAATCSELTPANAIIAPADINACRESVGSHAIWTQSSAGPVRCTEVTADNLLITNVDLGTCRESMGSHYDWRTGTAGRTLCAELTPDGLSIGYVDRDLCRKSVGSHFDWTKDDYGRVHCSELTQSASPIPNSLILNVGNDVCRNTVGSHFGMAQTDDGHLYCSELSRENLVIAHVGRASCTSATVEVVEQRPSRLRPARPSAIAPIIPAPHPGFGSSTPVVDVNLLSPIQNQLSEASTFSCDVGGAEFRWSDSSKSICIKCNTDTGRVDHFVAPSNCS